MSLLSIDDLADGVFSFSLAPPTQPIEPGKTPQLSQWKGFSDLPSELIHQIASEAAERNDDGRPAEAPPGLLTVSQLSQTSKYLRGACYRALLYYVSLQAKHAPAFLGWLQHEPDAALQIRKVSFRNWTMNRRLKPCAVIKTFEWNSAAEKALVHEDRIMLRTVSDGSYQSPILSCLAVSTLSRMRNLRCLLDMPLEWSPAAAIRGSLVLPALSELSFSNRLSGLLQDCPYAQPTILMFDTAVQCNVQALSIEQVFSNDGRYGGSLFFGDFCSSWIGSALKSFTLTVHSPAFALFNHFNFQDLLDQMHSLQELKVKLQATKSNINVAIHREHLEPLMRTIVQPKHLSEHLVELQLHVGGSDPRQRWNGSFLLSELSEFGSLLRLAIPLPGLSADGDAIQVKLPSRLEELTFIDLANWAEWIRTRGTYHNIEAAVTRPFSLLSDMFRAATHPRSLVVIKFSDYCSVLQAKCRSRNTMSGHWLPQTSAWHKDSMTDLRQMCIDNDVLLLGQWEDGSYKALDENLQLW